MGFVKEVVAALLVLFLGASGATATVAPTACPTTPLSEPCCIPTQILFLVDASQSLQSYPKPVIFNAIKRARCWFEDGRVQTGLIVFNKKVELRIPLGSYTTDQWTSLVDDVQSNVVYEPNTPIAEAFWLAKNVFDSSSISSTCKSFVNRVTMIFTDGSPSQNKFYTAPTTPATTLDDNVPTGWLAYFGNTGVPVVNRTSYYFQTTVPSQSAALKDKATTNSRVVAVILPGATADDTANQADLVSYWKSGYLPGNTCKQIALDQGWAVATFCTNKGIADSAAARNSSQCYRYRQGQSLGYGYYPKNQQTSWHCAPYTDVAFPIASDIDQTITINSNEFNIDSIIAKTGISACPADQCFS